LDLVGAETQDISKDKEILEKIEKETTPDFLVRISKQVAEYLQQNKHLFSKLFLNEHGFEVGDEIIMNEQANEYIYSKK